MRSPWESQRQSDAYSGQSGEFVHKGTRLVIHQQKPNPVLNPPAQQVEIIEKTKKYTAAQIRAMDSATYQENLKNPEFLKPVEALFEDHRKGGEPASICWQACVLRPGDQSRHNSPR